LARLLHFEYSIIKNQGINWVLKINNVVWAGEVGRGGGVSKQRVPKFLTCSPKEFPIAPHFYPICFGKCCPLFTYIGGPKKRNSIFQNRVPNSPFMELFPQF